MPQIEHAGSVRRDRRAQENGPGWRAAPVGRRWLLAGMAALCCAPRAAWAEDAIGALVASGHAHIGAIEALRGQVRVERAGEPGLASEGTPLAAGDVVLTAEDARAVLALGETAHLRLGGAASLRIVRFDPEGAAFALDSGALLFSRLTLGEALEVEVKAPFGHVKGACKRFFVGQLENGYGVQVMQGSLTVTADGASVNLEPGDGTEIAPGSLLPGSVRPWSEARIREALALVD